MKALKTFTINFASLADGEHLFDYQIDNKFLKHFENSLVHEAAIEVQLMLYKFLNNMELNFKIKGTVQTSCDLCAEDFDLSIDGAEQILVKIVAEPPAENNGNIVYLPESANSISITEMIYELIVLSMPMRKVHPEDEAGEPTCDESVLKYLHANEDYPTSNSEEEESGSTSINPIWDELKKLK